MKLLDPADVHAEQVRRMAHTFTKVDRVLTQKNVWCEVTDKPNNNAPAWSDGKVITFNMAKIGTANSVEDITKITGLNYHEVCHILYTPRQRTDLVKTVVNEGMFFAFNILEDQRIETLFTSMYPGTVPYFVSAFMRFCLADEAQWESNHALAHGRRYLPANIRQGFRDRFAWPELMSDFDKVIDQYRLLVLPKDEKKALTLIRRFNRLLSKINPPQPPFGHDGSRDQEISEGTQVSQDEQKDAKAWAEWRDQEREENEEEYGDSKSDDNYEDSEDDQDGTESGDGDGDDEDEAGDNDGNGGGKSDDDGDESDDDSDSDGGDGEGSDAETGSDDEADDATDSQSGGSGAGSAGGDPDAMADEKLRDLINEAVEHAESMPEVIADAKSKQRLIIDGDGSTDILLPTAKWNTQQVDPILRVVSDKFARELERIRIDLDPGWKTHQSSGRVNMQRVIAGADLDECWDQWVEGNNDAADFEFVLYLDRSGSMSDHQMVQVCRAAWAINRAVQKINGSTTTFVFNGSSQVLYARDVPVEPTTYRQLGSSGGTEPSDGIRESMRIFQASRRTRKVAIFLTDGDWWNSGVNDDLISRMTKAGIITAMVFLGYGNGARHGCSVYTRITDASDLIPFAKALVKHAMTGGQ